VIAPAGFETYFIELAEAEDPGRGQELAAKYGVTYSSDWVAGTNLQVQVEVTRFMTGGSKTRRAGLSVAIISVAIFRFA